MSIRVRFAPSPTGFLHLGGARTALFNYLWARKNGGKFILRIEDTDLERSTDASTRQIIESMQWLGILWDEGPFTQSDHLPRHMEVLRQMAERGQVYRCFCSKDRLETMNADAQAEKRNPIYDRACFRIPKEKEAENLAKGLPFTWRFKVPDDGATIVPDTLRGGDEGCVFQNTELGDFNITRPGTEEKWGSPLYNFTCAVDDTDMGITHVIRGVEHLSNAPRQILMLNAMGAPVPMYTHLPLIMRGAKKMSKRDADADPRFPVSVSARRDLGYLEEATINFLALLGWSMDGEHELFTREDLIKNFDLHRLSKANANFDEDKYLHINGWYMRNLPRATIVERVKPFLAKAGIDLSGRSDEWLAFVIGLEIERCRLLADFAPALEYFFAPPKGYDEKGAKKIFGEAGAAETLRECAALVAAAEPFDIPTLEAAFRGLSEKKGVGLGKIAQPVRLAVTGRTASPGLFEVLVALGKAETAARIDKAAAWIEANPPTAA